MSRVSHPHDAKAGPTKPAVRAVLLSKLDLAPGDHFAEVGSCTGAVTIEAARRAGQVTALERKESRLETTRKNLATGDRVLATETTTRPAFESQLAKTPVATDGEGVPR